MTVHQRREMRLLSTKWENRGDASMVTKKGPLAVLHVHSHGWWIDSNSLHRAIRRDAVSPHPYDRNPGWWYRSGSRSFFLPGSPRLGIAGDRPCTARSDGARPACLCQAGYSQPGRSPRTSLRTVHLSSTVNFQSASWTPGNEPGIDHTVDERTKQRG
jgi:hypothetical protein